MPHDYDGQDALALSIGAYISGKGYWTSPQVPDDSDDRDAATMALGTEGVADRTVWIAWRFVNGLEGGTYSGAITWTGAHVHQGTVSFTNALPVTFAHSLTASAGTTTLAALQVNGAATLAGGVALPVGSVLQTADVIAHVGDDAYRSLRKAPTQGTGNQTIQPWKYDLWICPTLPAARVWTLDHPPGGAIVRTTVQFPNPTIVNTLTLSDGGALAVLGVGAYKSVVIIYDGAAWSVESSNS